MQSFEALLEAQKREATGQRAEMLGRDLTGTKKMIESVLLPVLGTLKGLRLEHELASSSGMKIYIDVTLESLGIAFESEGFVAHAENITRDRFSFERMRIRTIAMYGYRYIPYAWDELDKKPDACRRSLYELLGRIGGLEEAKAAELSVMERELIRWGVAHSSPFRMADVCGRLQFGQDAGRRLIRRLKEKGLVVPLGGSERRCHMFEMTEEARSLIRRLR